jgi:hypothetical protein
MVSQILSGSVIFLLGYMFLPSHYLPGPPVLKGMLWAMLLWGIAEGLPAAMRALLGYLVYGATLSGIAGITAPQGKCTLHAV